MRKYSQFLEDIQQRRLELAQRSKDQMTRFKQKSAQSVSDAGQRVAADKERLSAVSD